MIRVFEDTEFHEEYKLDIQVEYSILDTEEGIDIDAVPSELVLETLGETIEDEIIKNKEYICKNNQFKDFNITFSTFNSQDGVLMYEVETEFKIVGKYFTDKVASVLKHYKTIVYQDSRKISVVVEAVSPMLRYIGNI